MKEIVIIGGGYAGVAAGLHLRKHLKTGQAKVTLINKHDYHIFTPSLYEVATEESPMKNIAIPLNKIFSDGVDIVKGTVEKIDTGKQEILIKDHEPVHYDYLIVALGSQAAYYHIPGLEEHAIPFKTLNNAVKIQQTINGQCLIENGQHKKLQVIIGGGGFAGTELAAEILTYRQKISAEHRMVKDCIEMTIIQGSNRVLKELDEHVSHIATRRLREPGMKLAFGGHIKEVTEAEVITDDGKKYPYDVLIWTGGVEPNHIAKDSGLTVTKHGGVDVDQYLQMKSSENIFAAGDNADSIDPKTEKPIPNVAQVAEDQGKTAAENVLRRMEGKPLEPYAFKHWGYIVPLKGRFAAAELMGWLHFDGFLGWGLQQLVFLQYLMKILPLSLALKRWNVFELELDQ